MRCTSNAVAATRTYDASVALPAIVKRLFGGRQIDSRIHFRQPRRGDARRERLEHLDTPKRLDDGCESFDPDHFGIRMAND